MAEVDEIVIRTESTGELPPPGSVLRQLLVVACPRSGTRYFARLLTKAGLSVAHERDGIYGMVNAFLAVDAEPAMPGDTSPVLPRHCYRFARVWHLVRDPLRTIPSMKHLPDHWWSWQEQFTGIPCDLEPVMLKYAKCWHVWNLECSNAATQNAHRSGRPVQRVQLERIEELWPHLCVQLGLRDETSDCPNLPKVDYSKWKKSSELGAISWDDLDALDSVLSQKIRSQAIRYGYGDNGATTPGKAYDVAQSHGVYSVAGVDRPATEMIRGAGT